MITGCSPLSEQQRKELQAYQEKNEEEQLLSLFEAMGMKDSRVWKADDGGWRASGIAPQDYSISRSLFDLLAP